MNLLEETQALHSKVAEWTADSEWVLLTRYDLLRKKPIERWYRWIRNLLARLRLTPLHVTKDSWLPTLKHAQIDCDYTILLIWAVGVGRDELRQDCEGFEKWLEDIPELVPVLITDVADFAYFSRLKWLVEYVPNLRGEGPSYSERKQRYLAWRYRDALVVPVSAGNASAEEWIELMELNS